MTLKWWQKAVFYQIYPCSFADGNGDGIGDFKGMTEKLDYLKDLGVDALWLSPHFPSPNWDCGYDISDYCGVAPEYGNLGDFKIFLREAHARELRVILDLVLNHTSDEHPWFIESKSSRDNPKADWYVWMDSPRPLGEGLGGEGVPPNNWQSCFDGEAWTYVPERGQYYYHYFMKQQPDLNWHNPEVVAAMWGAARFWLDLGVDGYRLDALGTIFEDSNLTPHTVPMTLAELRHATDLAKTPKEKKKIAKYWHDMFKNQWAQPGVHDLMKELRAILDEYPGDRMLVGEDDNPEYMGNGDDELQLVFNFPLMRTESPLTPRWIRENQKARLSTLAKISPFTWPCNTFGNHDSPRVYNRYADGVHDAERARLALATMLTLKGTPFLYNGEEIGMTDYLISDPSKLRDTMATWYYDRLVNELKVEPAIAAQRAAAMTRDKNRTPLQWSASANSGFCPSTVEPWLPVNPNYADGINVKEQLDDPLSLLNFYKRMLRLRKSTPTLVEGDYQPVQEKSDEYLAFLRKTNSQTVLVILSFSKTPEKLNFSKLPYTSARTIFSSAGRSKDEENLKELHLGAFEVYIAELS
jgi:alpha-glucosidase